MPIVHVCGFEILLMMDVHDIKPETSPALFVSKRTGRGPLKNNWQETVEPVMCAYKLVTVHFKWFGFQKMVESFTHTQYPRLFSKFHREVFCWIDNWYGMTMADIREIEDKAQRELDEGSVLGTTRIPRSEVGFCLQAGDKLNV
uniref:Phosphatidylinositol transfer protein n=1 Tax=Ascaris lumbricoides TaxID=6252 RepID=A0A0M3HI87_ASCLU